MNIDVIFSEEVDLAILHHLDFVDISEIPQTINSIENAKVRLEKTLSTFPMGGKRFRGDIYYFPVQAYVFIYEIDHENNAIQVLDLHMPGENWTIR